jgi:hypothetical protein
VGCGAVTHSTTRIRLNLPTCMPACLPACLPPYQPRSPPRQRVQEHRPPQVCLQQDPEVDAAAGVPPTGLYPWRHRRPSHLKQGLRASTRHATRDTRHAPHVPYVSRTTRPTRGGYHQRRIAALQASKSKCHLHQQTSGEADPFRVSISAGQRWQRAVLRSSTPQRMSYLGDKYTVPIPR